MSERVFSDTIEAKLMALGYRFIREAHMDEVGICDFAVYAGDHPYALIEAKTRRPEHGVSQLLRYGVSLEVEPLLVLAVPSEVATDSLAAICARASVTLWVVNTVDPATIDPWGPEYLAMDIAVDGVYTLGREGIVRAKDEWCARRHRRFAARWKLVPLDAPHEVFTPEVLARSRTLKDLAA